jgi:hypothetical protein
MRFLLAEKLIATRRQFGKARQTDLAIAPSRPRAIFDRFSLFLAPVHIRSAPKADLGLADKKGASRLVGLSEIQSPLAQRRASPLAERESLLFEPRAVVDKCRLNAPNMNIPEFQFVEFLVPLYYTRSSRPASPTARYRSGGG